MDLSLSIAGRGRPSTIPMTLAVIRELEPADLELLSLPRNSATQNYVKVQRFRARHHNAARMLAQGMTHVQVSTSTGYDSQTIGLLSRDPAFRDLVAFYRNDLDAKFTDLQAGMVALGEDAVEVLRERLETAPEEFSTEQLTNIMVKTADRTGSGPSSTNVSVQIHADLASRLQQARERAAEAMKTIEAKPNDV